MASSPLENTLPEDVMQLILNYLEPRDFCHFSMTSRSIYDFYHLNSFYWRRQVVNTFRLPVSPLLKADGARWYWLYKKLKTESHVYTWGQGLRGNLGRSQGPRLPRWPLRPSMTYDRTSSPWPSEAQIPDEVGVIVDLQCGGWSTTLLTSAGKLYTVGIIDAADNRHVGTQVNQFTPLEYMSQSTTGIASFSAGRRHILALDDNGEILSWDRINAKGYKVYTDASRHGGGKPKNVVAGWTHSSAYIPDIGIVYWDPVVNNNPDTMIDAMRVMEMVVPDTIRIPSGKSEKIYKYEVQRHVVLEGFILWIADTTANPNGSKLFAYAIKSTPLRESVIEVPGYAGEGRQLVDVQGSFRSFVVFTATGEVLAGDTGYLERCLAFSRTLSESDASSMQDPNSELIQSRPEDVLALQHKGVIALAFGDWHYLALHANGKITAYGKDPRGVGALGLGQAGAEAMFRGLRTGPNQDGTLLPIAYRRGREVWFEPEKRAWLQWMHDWITNRPETQDQRAIRAMFTEDSTEHAAFSEWVEQEGRNWEYGPLQEGRSLESFDSCHSTALSPSSKLDHDTNLNYDKLGAYFAISIAAAGWHSGALVLVNDTKADATRQKWIIRQEQPQQTIPGQFESNSEKDDYIWECRPFPRLRLPDGFEMGGKGDFTRWRNGMPSWSDIAATVSPEQFDIGHQE